MTNEVREALVDTLREVREENPSYWTGVSTRWLTEFALTSRGVKRSTSSVRRHLHALEKQNVVRNVGWHGVCLWQYITNADRQQKAVEHQCRVRAERLESALAERFGIEAECVTVYPHYETLLSVDLSMAESLLSAKERS